MSKTAHVAWTKQQSSSHLLTKVQQSATTWTNQSATRKWELCRNQQQLAHVGTLKQINSNQRGQG